MLKYIGLLGVASLLTLGLNANPTYPNCNTISQEISVILDMEDGNCPPISAATLDLLLKKGAEAFKTPYPDMCTAYARGSLTISQMPMATGDIMYTMTLDGCGFCTLDSELGT